ncbi:MAG: S41 family peptidase [Candidatus Zixiibacteriota bacterium]|nr:MAG: S41 family peptidase [candidate division Zixibacteria bacterium]
MNWLNYFNRYRVSTISAFISILLLMTYLPLYGQTAQNQDPDMDDSAKAEVIDSVLSAFKLHYLYPDQAKKFNKQIRNKYKKGVYDEIGDLNHLTRQLSNDLREISGDLHIRVSVMSPDDFSPAIGDTITQDKIAKKARENFYFKKMEWLPGNIGYLRLDRFDDPVYAGPTAVAAMNFLENCDAIIIDLRYNGGGEEKMVRLLASYFFKEPIQINSLYFTESDSLEQSWTYAYVPGKKLINADLYILTSGNTASGAEAFTYGLKNRGRAKVIGESTAGAAHWAEYYDFPNLQVRAKIPVARPINPVTKTSWEKVGVKPDIETPAGDALNIAQIEALKSLVEKNSDEDIRRDLNWHLIRAEAQLNPVILTGNDMRKYKGTYDRYAILIKEGQLYWRYLDGTDYILIPITVDLFAFDDTEDIRLNIVRNENGDVHGFRLVYRDGSEGSVKPRTGEAPSN